MAVRILRGSERNDLTEKYATHWFNFPWCVVLVGLSVGNASKTFAVEFAPFWRQNLDKGNLSLSEYEVHGSLCPITDHWGSGFRIL